MATRSASATAWVADRYGDVVWRPPPSFNAPMAEAATVTVCEDRDLVPRGELARQQIGISAVYVDRVVVQPSVPMQSWREAN